MGGLPIKDLLVKGLEGCSVTVIGVDPGETTGICAFRGSTLLNATQLDTSKSAVGGKQIEQYIDKYRWKVMQEVRYASRADQLLAEQGSAVTFHDVTVVVEDYRVYSWKTKDHAWASLHTPRLIGAIEYVCESKAIPMVKQMAQVAKGFCTDDKLKEWGLWLPGQRHARDAIRHAVYYLLFEVAKVHKNHEAKDV